MLFTIVHTNSCKIIETLGKFSRIARPGINFYIPFIQGVVSTIPVNVSRIIDFEFQVKTKDNAFCTIRGLVQYYVKDDDKHIINSHYSLGNYRKQIFSYVENSVRSFCPKLTLDELCEQKDSICSFVKAEIGAKMIDHGFTITDTLVNDVMPSEEVIKSMNQINVSKRLLEAARHNAEADRVAIIAKAEAEKMKMVLYGEGVSGQRAAILNGYKESIDDLLKMGIPTDEALRLVTLVQQIDAVKELSISPNAKVIYSSFGIDERQRDAYSQALNSCN